MNIMKRFLPAIILAFCLASAYSLEIYRPENFGDMNEIPCIMHVYDMDGNDASDCITGISFSWYYDIRLLHRYYDGCFTGGSVIHLSMKEGRYRISFSTPMEMQGEYADLTGKSWTSNDFIYNTKSPALKVIFVSPTGDDNSFYTGGWYVDYRAPKFFKYTKPIQLSEKEISETGKSDIISSEKPLD